MKGPIRSRPVNSSPSEDLAAHECSPDSLPGRQQREKARIAEAAVATWNRFNAAHGSFADEYASL